MTAAAVVTGPNGERVNVTGDMQGAVFQIDVGTSDGVFDTDSREVSSGSTTSTLAMTTSPAFTSANIGAPFWVVDGSGNLVRVTCAAGATGSITTRRNMTAASDGVQVAPGGIVTDIESNWWTLGLPWKAKVWGRTRLHYDVQSAGELWFASGYDQTASTVNATDPKTALTASDGEYHFPTEQKAKSLKHRILAIQAGFDVTVFGLMHLVEVEKGP